MVYTLSQYVRYDMCDAMCGRWTHVASAPAPVPAPRRFTVTIIIIQNVYSACQMFVSACTISIVFSLGSPSSIFLIDTTSLGDGLFLSPFYANTEHIRRTITTYTRTIFFLLFVGRRRSLRLPFGDRIFINHPI